jgi:hypothetical protein
MITAKEKLLKIIEVMPETEVAEILDFTEYVTRKNGKNLGELKNLSEIKIEYWDNDVYDEIWLED